MTTLRRELRETLQWCLSRQLPFTGADICEAIDKERFTVNRQLRLFVKMGLLEREQLIGSGMPYQYTVINRQRAQTLAAEQTKQRYEKAPRTQFYGGRVNSVFQLGAQ